VCFAVVIDLEESSRSSREIGFEWGCHLNNVPWVIAVDATNLRCAHFDAC